MTETTTDQTPAGPAAPLRFPRRAMLVAGFVTLMGPLIGALTLLIFVFGRIIAGTRFEDLAVPHFADVAQVVLVVGMFAYLLAGWSAFLAGVLLGWWIYVHGTFGYGVAMLVAVVATVIGTASLDLIIGRSDQSFVGMALFFTPFSIVAASFGRWVMGWLGVLPSSPPSSVAQHPAGSAP